MTPPMTRRTRKPDLSCRVISGARSSSPIVEEARAQRLTKEGQTQTYCDTCKLAAWPEEARLCSQFKPSPELEAFYNEQEKLNKSHE